MHYYMAQKFLHPSAGQKNAYSEYSDTVDSPRHSGWEQRPQQQDPL